VNPHIGQIVHYVPLVTIPKVSTQYASRCRAAIITDYHRDNPETVTLAILAPNGLTFEQVHHSDNHWLEGTWHWPEGAA
jgi:hypothetical protein